MAGVGGNVSIWIFAAGRGLRLPLSFLTIHVFASLNVCVTFIRQGCMMFVFTNNMHLVVALADKLKHKL